MDQVAIAQQNKEQSIIHGFSIFTLLNQSDESHLLVIPFLPQLHLFVYTLHLTHPGCLLLHLFLLPTLPLLLHFESDCFFGHCHLLLKFFFQFSAVLHISAELLFKYFALLQRFLLLDFGPRFLQLKIGSEFAVFLFELSQLELQPLSIKQNRVVVGSIQKELMKFVFLADQLLAFGILFIQMQPEKVLFAVQVFDLGLESVDQHPQLDVFCLDELDGVEGVHIPFDCVFEEIVKIFHGSVDLVAELVLGDRVVVLKQVPEPFVELPIIQQKSHLKYDIIHNKNTLPCYLYANPFNPNLNQNLRNEDWAVFEGYKQMQDQMRGEQGFHDFRRHLARYLSTYQSIESSSTECTFDQDPLYSYSVASQIMSSQVQSSRFGEVAADYKHYSSILIILVSFLLIPTFMLLPSIILSLSLRVASFATVMFLLILSSSLSISYLSIFDFQSSIIFLSCSLMTFSQIKDNLLKLSMTKSCSLHLSLLATFFQSCSIFLLSSFSFSQNKPSTILFCAIILSFQLFKSWFSR